MKNVKFILIFFVMFLLTFFLMSTPSGVKDSKDKKSNIITVNCPDFFPDLAALENLDIHLESLTTLGYIGDILEQSLKPLQELEFLGNGFEAFPGLEVLDSLDEILVESLQGLEELKGLEGLKGLEALKGLEGLKGLGALKGLEGLKGLEDLKGLEGLKVLENLDLDIDMDFDFDLDSLDIKTDSKKIKVLKKHQKEKKEKDK